MAHSTTKVINRTQEPESALPTFLEHLQELKGRLFWVAVFFVLFAAASFPFYDHIVNAIIHPIGAQKLYYMTPAGGLSFIIKVCMYVGLISSLPVIVYHTYKFISPVVHKRTGRSVLIFSSMSILLAFAGILFVYFVSLPAALHFLTNIDLGQISPLITIDAYISFVMAYLFAGVLLFQLPLMMLLFDSVTPVPPAKLFGFQRYVIVGSFILAAIISPTPDVINQTLLAVPIIVMYQIGVFVVWVKHRSKKRKARRASSVADASSRFHPPTLPVTPTVQPAHAQQRQAPHASAKATPITPKLRPQGTRVRPRRVVDNFLTPTSRQRDIADYPLDRNRTYSATQNRQRIQ